MINRAELNGKKRYYGRPVRNALFFYLLVFVLEFKARGSIRFSLFRIVNFENVRDVT